MIFGTASILGMAPIFWYSTIFGTVPTFDIAPKKAGAGKAPGVYGNREWRKGEGEHDSD